jgi:hypothetical protein
MRPITNCNTFICYIITMYKCMHLIEFLKVMENSIVCRNMRTFRNYVTAGDKTLVIPNNSGSSNNNTILGRMKEIGRVLLWGLQQVWNVISTILFIIGCPVDRMSAYTTSLCAQMYADCNKWFETVCSCFRPSSATAGNIPMSTTVSNTTRGRGNRPSSLGNNAVYSPVNTTDRDAIEI